MNEKLKNGDIIIFNSHGMNAKVVKFFTGGSFNHSALIFRCPITNDVFVWETGEIPPENIVISKQGCIDHFAHLSYLYNKYPNEDTDQLYVRRLRNKFEKKLSIYEWSRVISRNLGKKYDNFLVKYWNDRHGVSFLDLPFLDGLSLKEEAWSCAELIISTLYQSNVLEIQPWGLKSKKQLTPSDMYSMPSKGYDWCPMVNGFYYDKPEKIYDVNENTKLVFD